jgi:hypothetical protein
LVCKDNDKHEAHVLATFVWGFDITAATMMVAAQKPDFWGPPTQSYLNTLTSYFDGTKHGPYTSVKWTFDNMGASCFTCVPESSTLLVVCSAGMPLGIVWYRSRRHSAKAAA